MPPPLSARHDAGGGCPIWGATGQHRVIGNEFAAVSDCPAATPAHYQHCAPDQRQRHRVAVAVDGLQPVVGDDVVAHTGGQEARLPGGGHHRASFLRGAADRSLMRGALDAHVRHLGLSNRQLCAEVLEVVESGVVVVAAAGDFGHHSFMTEKGAYEGYAAFSITDPGNAESVITVGSTHRTSRHTNGVSFFSSRGPTDAPAGQLDLTHVLRRNLSYKIVQKVVAGVGLGPTKSSDDQ